MLRVLASMLASLRPVSREKGTMYSFLAALPFRCPDLKLQFLLAYLNWFLCLTIFHVQWRDIHSFGSTFEKWGVFFLNII